MVSIAMSKYQGIIDSNHPDSGIQQTHIGERWYSNQQNSVDLEYAACTIPLSKWMNMNVATCQTKAYAFDNLIPRWTDQSQLKHICDFAQVWMHK
jgi:hypothetical protein